MEDEFTKDDSNNNVEETSIEEPAADQPAAAESSTKAPTGIEAQSVVKPTMELPSYYARKRRRKLIAVGLMLLALLALLFVSLSYFLNRTEPLPTVTSKKAKAQTLPPPLIVYAISGGPGDLALKQPLSVAIHPNGNVYVTSRTAKYAVGRIEVFTPTGTYLFTFNKIKGGTLGAPVDIAINSKGQVYISDNRKKAVFVFSTTGKFIKQFFPNNDTAFEWSPMGLAFDARDNLYVTDLYNEHRVLAFSPSGKMKLNIGTSASVNKKGEYPGKFFFPNEVFVDRDRKIYVADSNNRRIQVFSETGKFIRLIETAGLPRGIAIDAKNRLYVVDALGHDVSVYKKTTKSGPVLTVFGGMGIQLGQMLYPNYLALNKSGRRIYVADRENNRVDVFEWPDTEQPIIGPAKKLIPLAGVLLPLFLLLAYLLGRRRRFFADKYFIANIVTHNHLTDLKKKTKKVFVSIATYELFKDYVEGDLKGSDVLVEIDPDPEAVKAIMKKYDLDEETAILFAGAQRGLKKPRILAETKDAHLTALDMKMESMDHKLFVDTYDLAKKPEKKAAKK